jgi:hypothetical protein
MRPNPYSCSDRLEGVCRQPGGPMTLSANSADDRFIICPFDRLSHFLIADSYLFIIDQDRNICLAN